MRKQDIEIQISPTGEVTFTVKGIKGASCLGETAFLEDALGNAVVDQERTTEFYEAPEGVYQSAQAGEDDDG